LKREALNPPGVVPGAGLDPARNQGKSEYPLAADGISSFIETFSEIFCSRASMAAEFPGLLAVEIHGLRGIRSRGRELAFARLDLEPANGTHAIPALAGDSFVCCAANSRCFSPAGIHFRKILPCQQGLLRGFP
jgi:hypothetical protein